MADTTTELEVLAEIVEVLGGQSGQHETVVPVLEDIRDLLGGGGGGGSADFTPEVGYDGSEVTIKFAHTMGAKLTEVLDYHIVEFNKLYPNIHIEHSSYGGWSDISGLINTEIIGDNQPIVDFILANT